MTLPRLLAIAALAIAAAATPARAATLTVGVFAPAVPFEGPPARIEFASRLARHLGAATGTTGVGRVYARASDFAAAVRRGEIQVAVVDAAYLATHADGHTVLAVAAQGRDPSPPWQLVARSGVRRVTDLRGRSLLVPALGGREADFALHALFAGELPRGFFSSIAASPDARSAVAAIALGKADAAVVPGDLALPDGVHAVTGLPRVSAPLVVAYPSLAPAARARVVAALASFDGDPVLASFQDAGPEPVRALAARLAAPRRAGPMIVPALRLPLDVLLGERRPAIEVIDPLRFATPPKK